MKPYDKPRKGGSFKRTGNREHSREAGREQGRGDGRGYGGYNRDQSRGYNRDQNREYGRDQNRGYKDQGRGYGRDQGRGYNRDQNRGYDRDQNRRYDKDQNRGHDKEQRSFSPRDRFMKRARESVQEAFKSRDMVLSGVTKTIEETQKVINQLDERFESWYEVYLPELRLEDRRKYVEVAIAIDKENMDFERIAAIVGNRKAEEILAMTTKTLGAKLGEKDLGEIKLLGERIVSLYVLCENLERYQIDLAKEIAPNMSEVAGPEIAAKLIAHVGSLKRLAFLPSSTIQVLGAEKALFKHLKNRRVAPPKHGIIFQHAKISNSPKETRGKIARALANKLALAARADAFSKNFIAKQLKEDFDKRCAEILGS